MFSVSADREKMIKLVGRDYTMAEFVLISLNFHQGPSSTQRDQPKNQPGKFNFTGLITLTQQTHGKIFGKNAPEY